MTKEDVLEIVAQRTREIVPGLEGHAFAAADRLADLGASSVDRAEIAMLAQESLGLSLPRVELFGPKNLGELADLLLRRMNGA